MNTDKTKTMLTNKTAKENMPVGRYPCRVCGSGVGVSSIQCIVYDRRCSGLKSHSRMADFCCSACVIG